MKCRSSAHQTTTCTPASNLNQCKTPNVRTVLFQSSSISKQCWNADEVSLLFSRAIIQNILPRKVPKNLPLLLYYFKMCIQIIKKEIKNVYVRKMIATAMIDTLGGYLQSYGLPITKRTFYEGNLDFEIINEFYSLQNNFKTILSSDGAGWSRPIIIKERLTRVVPLKIPINVKEDQCQNIITNFDYRK